MERDGFDIFLRMAQKLVATRGKVVSKEAQKFIANSSVAEWGTLDLTENGVKTLRDENSEVAKPGCLRVVQELQTEIRDDIIGNVPVQWVTPKHVGGPEIILYLFGGGFVCGGPEDDLAISARLADGTNRCICVPRYRLAPEHPFPAAQQDVLAVYKAISKKHRLLVAGESAGGNLALGVILAAFSEKLQLPLAVALLSPWIDLTHSGESHQFQDLDPTLSVEHFLTPAALAYAGEVSPGDPSISPLFAKIPLGFPPTTISTGTKDLLYSDCIRLSTKLCELDVFVDLQITQGVWHVFEWYPELPEAKDSLQHISTFLSGFLNPKNKTL